MKLNDKTILLTGAARGIGQATAIELAKAGADIIGVDLKLSDLEDTLNAVEKTGQKFCGFECDVSDERATRELVNKAQETNSGFDGLINNAGVLPSGPFAEREFDVWRKVIDINLTGLMLLTHAALPVLMDRQEAHIVNIASIAGKFGTEGVAAYAASKHGVVGFSSALRAELYGTNVGVSWLCPSMANTRLASGVKEHFLTPMIQPEDVAKAVRRAIETNAIELHVPRWVRLVTTVTPALSPRFARWIARTTKASQSWLQARRNLDID